MTGRLPDGFQVRLDRRVRRLDGGAALLGGSPTRLLRLSPIARELLGGDGELTVGGPTSAALARRLLDGGLAHPVPARPPGSGGLPGSPGAADVTVVVPVRDRPVELARLLGALPAGPAALLVVDDGSMSPVQAPGAQVIRHPAPRGPAAARNTGLAAARTPFVAFLDSDVVPAPGWLEPLLAHFADPAVALVAPRITALPGPAPGWLARYEQLRSSLDLGPDPAPIVPLSRVSYVPGAAIVLRGAAVPSGFDAGMRVGEDVDLVLRLYAAGARMRYEPAATVAHDHRGTLGRWLARKAFYGTSAAPLALRHPGSVPPLVLAPWTAAAVGLLAVQRPVAAGAAVGVVALAWRRLAHRLGPVSAPTPGEGPASAPIMADGSRRSARLLAVRLVGTGLVGALWQVAEVLTRHHWPLTVLGCLLSRRVRRMAVAAAVAEGLADWATHRRPGGLGPVRYLLVHRADDMAYGAGLWWGALRHRTLAPLRPRRAVSPASRDRE